MNQSSLLSCAIEAARAAGTHALRNPARRTDVLELSAHDVKLQLDVECQQKATEAILARFPDHSILGEEETGNASAAESDFEWIIDPIDGTVNFSHGLPLWCSSIAVRQGDDVLAGAVYAPELDHLYTATRDGPACLNDSPIHVSETVDLATALVFTGIGKDLDAESSPFGRFERLGRNVQKARITGSATLDLCQVACGHGEGYFEHGIYIWDVAAGGLIIQRAGGQSEILIQHSAHHFAYIASNGHIHNKLKQLLALETG